MEKGEKKVFSTKDYTYYNLIYLHFLVGLLIKSPFHLESRDPGLNPAPLKICHVILDKPL